jgi:HNH endonuclease
MSRYISNALKEKIRQQAKFRCGYCLRSELLIGMPMEFEHLIPLALGGQTVEENLWLSCRRCNEFKGIQIQGFDLETSENAPLFNPRTQIWSEHFSWNIDGTEVIGITSIGRATVNTLNLNEEIIVVTRRLWVSVGWFPPED